MVIRQNFLTLKLIQNSLFALTTLVITSCTVTSPTTGLPPEQRSQITLPPFEQSPTPGTSELPEPAQVPAPPPVEADQPASNLLLASAREQLQAGDTSRAAATLERALRIAPNDPYLWHELAQVRFVAGEWQQAIQLANKSRVLAGNDIELRNRNSDLIAAAAERM